MKTLAELYRELINIKEQLNGMDIPLTVEGKEVEKVELLSDPLRVVIKTNK